ncbi:hypothetical protein ZWY2020_002186 [Hordeum vulgare]|nr:hypothetical protein ZWY2020_002186 [Hordeum vulgare]
MCAYTGINNVPACANSDLLTNTVRGDWGLDGYPQIVLYGVEYIVDPTVIFTDKDEVTAVGLNTEWGLLMANISKDNNEETPLQVRLNGVATFIGIVGLVVAAMVLVVLFARYFTGHTTDPDGTVQFVKGRTVTIVVVAVPEGLPLAVTLTLAYSMRKMMADKALVRRLSACETMGSATTICSDKTGTLTLNQMTVVRSIVGGIELQPLATIEKLSPTVTSLVLEAIAQNTSGSVFEPEVLETLRKNCGDIVYQ